MTPIDTLNAIKGAVLNNVTLVNATVLFGLTEMQWDLLLKILVGVGSFAFTLVKVYVEYKNAQKSKNQNDI
jgi:hypothetical protein